jgi:hypothetical protein
LKALYLLSLIFIFGVPCWAQTYRCLGSGVKETDVSSIRTVTSSTGHTVIEKITVMQALKEINARCVHDKLIDGKRREIRFYFVQGCWGNPPAGYLEILEKQRRDIEKLRMRYTVIEMTCNPDGRPPQSISRSFDEIRKPASWGP